MFSGLRQGSTLYVLDKSKEPRVITGFVERVSAPHPMYPNYNPNVSFGTNLQTVVDVTVKVGDDKKEFVGVPSSAYIHSYGDYVISESKDGMINEVTAMMENSKSIISNVEQHKSNITACEKILKELNPAYAKEQERDEAIDNISGRMNRIEDILARLESRLNT
jgi:23S rRNA maturation-related 3'-5' exoribonuclease YhaM